MKICSISLNLSIRLRLIFSNIRAKFRLSNIVADLGRCHRHTGVKYQFPSRIHPNKQLKELIVRVHQPETLYLTQYYVIIDGLEAKYSCNNNLNSNSKRSTSMLYYVHTKNFVSSLLVDSQISANPKSRKPTVKI